MQLPAHASLQVLSGLSPTQLLHTLASSYLGSPSASYGCRVLAAQLLLEVAAAPGARNGPAGQQETQVRPRDYGTCNGGTAVRMQLGLDCQPWVSLVAAAWDPYHLTQAAMQS